MIDYKTVDGDSAEGLAMHCIGMDYHKPYKRRGKLFYRPYRNYFATSRGGKYNSEWMELVGKGYAEMRESDRGYYFWLTRAGLDWLGGVLGIKIYDEEE